MFHKSIIDLILLEELTLGMSWNFGLSAEHTVKILGLMQFDLILSSPRSSINQDFFRAQSVHLRAYRIMIVPVSLLQFGLQKKMCGARLMFSDTISVCLRTHISRSGPIGILPLLSISMALLDSSLMALNLSFFICKTR